MSEDKGQGKKRRDDFSPKTVITIGKRAGFFCSDPECGAYTTGPHSNPEKAITMGKACHITAAAEGGPRYDPSLTPAQRKSAKNGIWMCAYHADLIDKDESEYTVEQLREWKRKAERRADEGIKGRTSFGTNTGIRSPSVVDSALLTHAEALAERLSDETKSRFEERQRAWEEGRRGEVLKWIEDLKTDRVRWETIPDKLKSRILRLECVTTLAVTGNTEQARRLAEEARALDPEHNDVRLRASIAYVEKGPEAALELLSDTHDPDNLNFKASLFLVLGRLAECLDALDFQPQTEEQTAERHRVTALYHLLSGDVAEARLEVQKALEIKPRDEGTRYAEAIINYASVLVVDAIPECVMPWPQPVERTFVKNDEENLRRLRSASDTFRELAEASHLRKEERRIRQAWRLGSLLLDSDQLDHARTYAEKILQEDPENFYAIAWTITYRLQVDLTPSCKVFKQAVSREHAGIQPVLALSACYLATGKAHKAVTLLRNNKRRFIEQNMEPLWRHWMSQAHIQAGQIKRALDLLEGHDEEGLRVIKTMALHSVAQKTDDWKPLIKHLESCYAQTNDARFLFHLCMLKMREEDWKFVADRAEILIDRISTGEAVRIAVVASYNARRFEVCLQMLRHNTHRFRGGVLPGDLKRVEVACMYELGHISEAISKAEALVTEDPSTANLLDLIHRYADTGDTKSVCVKARQLLNRDDLKPEQELFLAQASRLEDHELAAAFLKKAIQAGLQDEAVPAAYMLGIELGLRIDLDPLRPRMESLSRSGQAGVRVATFEDFRSYCEKRSTLQRDLDTAYRNGTVPIHLISDSLGEPLPIRYHHLLRRIASDPDLVNQPMLLIRHGGRLLEEGFPKQVPKIRLVLDISAVLLAHHCNLLPHVERYLRPLGLPHNLLPALRVVRDDLENRKAAGLRKSNQIKKLVDESRIRVEEPDIKIHAGLADLAKEVGEEWVNLYEAARAREGYLLTFLPVTKMTDLKPAQQLPAESARYLVNSRALLESLRQTGLLSETEYKKAVEDLGTEGEQSPSQARPEPGSHLFCQIGTLDLLAEAGFLPLICDNFQLWTTRKEVDFLHSDLEGKRILSETSAWLGGLADRLRQGISDGVYEVLPANTVVADDKDHTLPNAPATQCLRDLLAHQFEQGEVLWVDDRCLTGFRYGNGAPIWGINEVLKLLVAKGGLSDGDYYETLLHLRAGNCWFIPLEAGEIIYHLGEASCDPKSGMIMETRALKILRRYLASCLSRRGVLQKPTHDENNPNPLGEEPFVARCGREVYTAILRAYTAEGKDETTRRAWAEWILSNLYLDQQALHQVAGVESPNQNPNLMVALTIESLLTQSLEIRNRLTNDAGLRRKEYLQWVYDRIVKKRFDADPHLLTIAVNHLRTMIPDVRDKILAEVNHPQATDLANSLIGSFLIDLPEPIREEVSRDIEFVRQFGLGKTVSIGGLAFHADQFDEAVEKVMNVGEAEIQPVGKDTSVVFRRHPDHLAAVVFTDPETGKEECVYDPLWGLLSDSVEKRETILRQHRFWFDCDSETRDRAIAEICTTANPRKRLERAQVWRDSSAAVFYLDLLARFKGERRFRPKDLIFGNIEGLLRTLGLERTTKRGTPVAEALEEAAGCLLSDQGLIPTIERLSGLSVRLPDALMEAIARLSAHERHNLVKRLTRLAGSPISQIHLLHVLARFGEDNPAFRRLGRRMIKWLLSGEGKQGIESFFTVLRFVSDELIYHSGFRDLPADARLALLWSHGHQVFRLFAFAGADMNKVAEMIEGTRTRLPLDVFFGSPAYLGDVCHPRQVRPLPLVFSGLAYGLGEKARVWIDEGLRNHLRSRAFIEADGSRWPEPSLCSDPTLQPNSLQSFLGDDREVSWDGLMGTSDAKDLSRKSLEKVTCQALQILRQDPTNSSMWMLVAAVLADHPPYEKVTDSLKAVLRDSDFLTILRDDCKIGFVALTTASSQAAHLKDTEVLECIRMQVIKIAEARSAGNISGSRVDLADADFTFLLLQAALNLALAAEAPDDTLADLAETVRRIVSVWPKSVEDCRSVIQRLCEELPISLAQHLWRLLVELRAM